MSRRSRERSWSSTQTRLASGAFDSVQRMTFPGPVVARTSAGANRLGALYWSELRRSTLGVVRATESAGELRIRLLGVGPALLTFGPPEEAVDVATVGCRYPIRGGLLARAPAGSIRFTQVGADAVEVTSAVEGFVPRLAGRWSGVLYAQVQSRIHVALGRRYFARLRREARR